MQDYKARMAHAWEKNSKQPKKWASNQSLNTVRAAYDDLVVTMGKNNIAVHDVAEKAGVTCPVATACMWSLSKGTIILHGSRPLPSSICDVYDVICMHQTQYETSPTVREIREELHISISTIQAALIILAALCCIDYLVGCSRTIRLVMQPKDVHFLLDKINASIKETSSRSK